MHLPETVWTPNLYSFVIMALITGNLLGADRPVFISKYPDSSAWAHAVDTTHNVFSKNVGWISLSGSVAS